MYIIALLLYVLATPWAHDALRSSSLHARPLALVWPVVVILSILWELALWLWNNRPRWRWRRQWVREPRYSHYGWKTKTGKMCGIIVVHEIINRLERGNYGTVSGLMLPWGSVLLGTLTKP